MANMNYATTQKEYIVELEKALKNLNVPEIGEIIEEYRLHFEYKRLDGFSDEEIIAKLASPQIIAQQFAEGGKRPMNFSRAALSICIGMLDVLMLLVSLLPICWIIALASAALGSAAAGFGLITGTKIGGYLPQMPYIGALLLGIVCIGFGVLASIGAIYSFLYIRQWAKAYARWHKNQFDNGRYPNLSVSPAINSKLNRRLRTSTIIALMLTGVCFIVGYLILALSAGNIEFWHVYGWFI